MPFRKSNSCAWWVWMKARSKTWILSFKALQIHIRVHNKQILLAPQALQKLYQRKLWRFRKSSTSSHSTSMRGLLLSKQVKSIRLNNSSMIVINWHRAAWLHLLALLQTSRTKKLRSEINLKMTSFLFSAKTKTRLLGTWSSANSNVYPVKSLDLIIPSSANFTMQI